MIAVFPILSIYYIHILLSIHWEAKVLLYYIFRQIIVLLPVSLILVKGINMGALGVWLSYPNVDFMELFNIFNKKGI